MRRTLFRGVLAHWAHPGGDKELHRNSLALQKAPEISLQNFETDPVMNEILGTELITPNEVSMDKPIHRKILNGVNVFKCGHLTGFVFHIQLDLIFC